MNRFLRVHELNRENSMLINKKHILSITFVEGKKECCISFKTDKFWDKILVTNEFKELQQELEEFVLVNIRDKKVLVNLDNIIAIYETDEGTFLQTRFGFLYRFDIVTGYPTKNSINEILLKIKMTDKAVEKE